MKIADNRIYNQWYLNIADKIIKSKEKDDLKNFESNSMHMDRIKLKKILSSIEEKKSKYLSNYYLFDFYSKQIKIINKILEKTPEDKKSDPTPSWNTVAKKQKPEPQDMDSEDHFSNAEDSTEDENGLEESENKPVVISNELREYIGSKNKKMVLLLKNIEDGNFDKNDRILLDSYMLKQNLSEFFKQYTDRDSTKRIARLNEKYKCLNGAYDMFYAPFDGEVKDIIADKIIAAARVDAGITSLAKCLNDLNVKDVDYDIVANGTEIAVEELFLNNNINFQTYSDDTIVYIANKIGEIVLENPTLDKVKNILSINLKNKPNLIKKIKDLSTREEATYGEDFLALLNNLNAVKSKRTNAKRSSRPKRSSRSVGIRG